MGKREVGAPVWVEKEKRWRLSKQNEGKRKVFYSSDPSPRKGPAECRRKAQEWLDSFDLINNGKITFGEAWGEYMAFYERKYKITSYLQIEGRGKAHLLPAFKFVPLNRIKKSDWQQVIMDAYEGGAKSVRSLKGIVSTIKTFTRWAATRGYIDDHDVPLYFAYPTDKLSRTKKILQPKDFKLLLSPDQDDADWYINAWRFLAVTGLRRGELCALQLKRDYDGQSITIRESVSHDLVTTDGKTPQAQRTIILSQTAKDVIRKHELQLMKAGHRKRYYLFTDPAGRRISPRTLRNHWQTWRELHSIDVTLHELRHTYISYSRLKTEIPLEELQQLYGHSKNMDTDRTYVHSIEESVEERRKRIEQEEKNVSQIDKVIQNLLNEAK